MTTLHGTAGSTSSGWIRRVKQQEPEAWFQLSRLYAPLVWQWCQQAGLQPADTADIVQEVFAAVHKNVCRFRRESPQDSFRGWLWTITRNEVRMHFRRQQNRPQAAGGTEAQQALQEIPQFFAAESLPGEKSDQHALPQRALNLLQHEFEDRTWRAFWRTTMDGQSSREAADELGMSPGAVRQTKYAVLQRLRHLLADD